MTKKLILDEDMKNADSEEKGISSLIDSEGVALSDLRPAGIARIDDSRRDVVSSGDMIPEGSRVKVVEVDGNRLVVKQTGRQASFPFV